MFRLIGALKDLLRLSFLSWGGGLVNVVTVGEMFI